MKLPFKLPTRNKLKAYWKNAGRFLVETDPKTKQTAVFVAVSVLMLTVAGAAWSQTRPSDDPAAPHQADSKEVRALVAQVGKHIVVNEEEDPTIATVEDPESLRAQNAIFYRDAQKGDRLFIWSDKAVLYSTKQDRILAVLPINYPAPQTPTPVADAKAASVEVRNGSGIPGLGTKFGANLKKMGLNETVTGNAKGPALAHTIIVKSSDAVPTETLDLLASLTNGTVEDLPPGENAPNADILVLVGADYKP